MSPLRLLISESVDPWFNLAVEETIFNEMDPNQKVLFLWRNDQTVVIGRAQNPWKECNTRKMAEDHVKLARRQSGGGAVFHDLGNTNFTFMAGKPDYDKTQSTQLIIRALASLGIHATASGRNDLIIERNGEVRKISGSAYREKADRGFHHGTLLIDVDFTRLANYLNPDPKKLAAKGISSVRSRVANLTEVRPDLTHQMICQAIEQEFCALYGGKVTAEYISEAHPPAIDGFAAQFKVQSSWDWNFGKALEFSHHFDERFTWGGVEVQLLVQQGVMTAVKLYSDSLYLAALEALEQALMGQRYKKDDIHAIFNGVIEHHPEAQDSLLELQRWFVQQIQ
ncbi:lipoate--protein ligase [Wohlfahrtiimonas chitiniclastica]|uniref:lipoate--protein ligase n=1 Tax=Wohlfahrtiimonas chitiniclastica TaxID=400946 RepID=UPI000B9989A6|nr:lipoate--protein ligase [Wohlfahrtiimonas chitiniclastica]OYQ76353.1 lipoate--protein ligase [Wohlfahrtiimonas chitiniclastica]